MFLLMLNWKPSECLGINELANSLMGAFGSIFIGQILLLQCCSLATAHSPHVLGSFLLIFFFSCQLDCPTVSHAEGCILSGGGTE